MWVWSAVKAVFIGRKLTDLEVKARAFGHGGEGWYGGHGGEGTHQHEDTPAVELVGWAHLETPAWRQEAGKEKKRKEKEKE